MVGPSDYLTILRKIPTDSNAGTLVQVVVHLSHYSYAMQRLHEVASLGRSLSLYHSFYIEALYTLLANWFAIEGSNGNYLLKHALTKLGLCGALDPIDRLLDQTIGKTTFRTLVRDFRNWQATHKIFHGDIQVKLAEKHGIKPEVIAQRMPDFLDSMWELIVRLQQVIEAKFSEAEPELYELLRANGYFISLLP